MWGRSFGHYMACTPFVPYSLCSVRYTQGFQILQMMAGVLVTSQIFVVTKICSRPRLVIFSTEKIILRLSNPIGRSFESYRFGRPFVPYSLCSVLYTQGFQILPESSTGAFSTHKKKVLSDSAEDFLFVRRAGFEPA